MKKSLRLDFLRLYLVHIRPTTHSPHHTLNTSIRPVASQYSYLRETAQNKNSFSTNRLQIRKKRMSFYQRIVSTTFLALLVSLIANTYASAANYRVFGEKTYARSNGAPAVESDAFSLGANLGTYTLKIDNGGELDQQQRVSSAIIFVNGVQVVGANDLNKNVDISEHIVELSSSNEISVELRSKPGSALTITIEGDYENSIPQITSTPANSADENIQYNYDVDASDANRDQLYYSLAEYPAGMTIDPFTGLISWMPDLFGDIPVSINVEDGHGGIGHQSFVLIVTPEEVIPPNPSTVAPPVDTTAVTPLASATAFLYTGSNPIQTGMAPDTIEEKRVAIVRGKVLDRQNAPLSGVLIRIKDHNEYGQTLSREDGMFDMAVNGGGVIFVNYTKDGYLPVQRQIDTPWQDYVIGDDVVMIPVDEQVTTVDLTSAHP